LRRVGPQLDFQPVSKAIATEDLADALSALPRPVTIALHRRGGDDDGPPPPPPGGCCEDSGAEERKD